MEKYFSDDFIQKIVEKISTEVVSCIMGQIESAINEKQQKSVRTIEVRAKEYTKREYSQYKTSVQTVSRIAYIAGATEQKAIDEEVRLKKCDDMTEAEYNHETAFMDWYLENGKGTPTYSDAIEWARKEVINRACEWLKGNIEGGVHPQSVYGFVDKFRKAMEEQVWH